MDEVWRLIGSIPAGKVASYGAVGSHLTNPTTGRIVGRWLANCPEGIPWWRLVAKSGAFPVEKRGIGLGTLQAEHLAAEGVDTSEGRVDMDRYAIWDFD